MRRSQLVFVFVLTLLPILSGAQDTVFLDGFEIGGMCRWSSQTPAQVCSEITVPLSGGVNLEMVWIPPGTFDMGSPDDEQGRLFDENLHEVTLTRGYFLGKNEITQAQWQAVTGTPMPTSCGEYGIGPSFPVYCVSWHEVMGPGGFADQINARFGITDFRLPTEAEAERAIRGGTETRFSHGDVLDPPCDDYCSFCTVHNGAMAWCGNTIQSTEPTGSRQANAFGLHDVHGNVLEWTLDWYTYLLGTDPQTDPTGPATGTARVLRGGHWEEDARHCRSASRTSLAPSGKTRRTGFRLAMTK